jgi:mannosyl-glycoprotein endo-beta-N-acetylglucosaminidase
MLPGTQATIISGPQSANGYQWWQISVASGTGWAAGQYLRRVVSNPTPPPGATYQPGDTVRTTASLNLRSLPGTASTILTVLATGAVGTVVSGPENASGYEWWRVTFPQGTGWVAATYLASSSQPPPPPPPPTYLPGATVRTTTDLRLRSAATVSSSTLLVMAGGSTATVLGGPEYADGYTWWRVQQGSTSGWAAGAFLTPA